MKHFKYLIDTVIILEMKYKI